ncbi:unnamed protein product [Peniophora sp. CBMAI 1063]|nr:unnamed protein product [Peniophora sp. CBMAI 1063]
MSPSKLQHTIDVADLYDEDTDTSTDGDAQETLIEKIAPEVHVEGAGSHVPAGCLPDEAYENALPPIRLAVRKRLVRCVEWESRVLGRWQAKLRNVWLDRYFLTTSMLGTHTFFMLFLPSLFYFGHDTTGRGLTYVSALGVYATSFFKDFACSPRPYAPPVTRLTIGSHHLEYGFPSSHTANSTSMALFLLARVYPLWVDSTLSTPAFSVIGAFLLFYVFTIIGGRLYLGMHGFVDCTMGFTLGVGMWLIQILYMPILEDWLRASGWMAPLTTLGVILLMVNQHPQPVDDCPCFEDAIAFMSVALGILLSVWAYAHVPFFNTVNFVTLHPGYQLDTPRDYAIWTLFAVIKLVAGILAIFAWRLIAKPTAQSVLPPFFRFLARFVRPLELPNRRHYTPATEYAHHPPHNLRPIPSMLDLSLSVTAEGADAAGIASALDGKKHSDGTVTRRGNGSSGDIGQPEKVSNFYKLPQQEQREKVLHYDADVLTKVFVYAGIAIVASLLTPTAFEVVGLGVRMS